MTFEVMYLNPQLLGPIWRTFQLRERSIWPATYEASPESLACMAHRKEEKKKGY